MDNVGINKAQLFLYFQMLTINKSIGILAANNILNPNILRHKKYFLLITRAPIQGNVAVNSSCESNRKKNRISVTCNLQPVPSLGVSL